MNTEYSSPLDGHSAPSDGQQRQKHLPLDGITQCLKYSFLNIFNMVIHFSHILVAKQKEVHFHTFSSQRGSL